MLTVNYFDIFEVIVRNSQSVNIRKKSFREILEKHIHKTYSDPTERVFHYLETT